MEPFVEESETRLVDMGVDLGGRDVRMAQHRLHGPQVRAVVQQMGRERMAEHMGADPLRRNASFERVCLDQTPEVLA